MEFDFSQPKETRLYERLKPVAKFLLNTIYNFDCHGKENIPDEGGFIIAANHIAYLDPVMIIANCKRTCHFMAKHDSFDHLFLGSFLKKMNVFPVRRGTSDKNALGFAEKIINNGWVLGIFPEGTRSKDLTPKEPKNGVAYIARKTRASVLPVSIHKDRKSGVRTRIVLRFGKMIDNSRFGFENDYKPSQIRNASKMIMDDIKALWQLDEEN